MDLTIILGVKKNSPNLGVTSEFLEE